MPRINVGELSLNYEERGQGPAFLFIPGLVGLLNAWEFQVAEFSKRYRCIAFDHRGAGDSDKPKDSYSTQALARNTDVILSAMRAADDSLQDRVSSGDCGCPWQDRKRHSVSRLHN